MKLISKIAVIMLISILVFTFIACNNDSDKSADTTVEEATTEGITTEEATTDENTTVAETTVAETTVAEITTVEETTTVAETTVEEETTESSPITTLTKVGKSLNGKYDCYDGRYDFSDDIGNVTAGTGGSFGSFQDAVDAMVDEGGGAFGVDPLGSDIGICVNLTIPDDGKNYVIYYNYCNIDFNFNLGVTFDDCSENPTYGTNGYAYYSSLAYLDALDEDLTDCHIFVWSATEGLTPGYYKMVKLENPSQGLNYSYERLGSLEDTWTGLYLGESYF